MNQTMTMALPVPAVGTLDSYIQAVNRMPMLSAEEEISLARRYRDSEDINAARKLVLSHLRVVVSTARGYLGYGLPHADLIQEGNIGLMKAVKRYDPERGVRLVSFAIHWIKAEMHEYILKNWRLMKIATRNRRTRAQQNSRITNRFAKPGSAQPPYHRSALAARKRRGHAARPCRRVQGIGRAHPPDRGQSAAKNERRDGPGLMRPCRQRFACSMRTNKKAASAQAALKTC